MMRIFVLNTVMVLTVNLSRLVVCKAVNCSEKFTYCWKGPRLSSVPSDIPPDIIEIFLAHNDISDITGSPFINNSMCTKLSLDSNRLVEVEVGYWVGLLALRLLSLQFNQIRHIEVSAFAILPQLKGLYLLGNKLHTLSASIFKPHSPPTELQMTLHRNKLQFDSRLCWLQRGLEDGSITLIKKLDGLDTLQCSTTESPNNKITEGTNISERIKSTPTGTIPMDVTPAENTSTDVTMETKLLVYESVEKSDLPMDTLHWVLAVTVCVAVLILLAAGIFCLLRFNVPPCRDRSTSHESLEMQPCGTTTSVENRDSQGYLLPVPGDEASQPSGPSQSSGVYSYAYDHFRDRFIAFLSIHLRHIQELYARRNSGSSPRPSVPPTQAPSPPDHTPPSSPLIPPSPPTGAMQHTSPSDESLENKSQIHVSSSRECTNQRSHMTAISESTHFYENIPSNGMTDYADVI